MLASALNQKSKRTMFLDIFAVSYAYGGLVVILYVFLPSVFRIDISSRISSALFWTTLVFWAIVVTLSALFVSEEWSASLFLKVLVVAVLAGTGTFYLLSLISMLAFLASSSLFASIKASYLLEYLVIFFEKIMWAVPGFLIATGLVISVMLLLHLDQRRFKFIWIVAGSAGAILTLLVFGIFGIHSNFLSEGMKYTFESGLIPFQIGASFFCSLAAIRHS